MGGLDALFGYIQRHFTCQPLHCNLQYDYSELVEIASLPIIPTLGLEATY